MLLSTNLLLGTKSDDYWYKEMSKNASVVLPFE
jgi:hypothetical protein